MDISNDGRVLVVGMSQGMEGVEITNAFVKVFRYNGGTNNWIAHGQTLVSEEEADHFGIRVALSGDGSLLAVGSTRSSVAGLTLAGRVHTFKFDTENNKWQILGKPIDGLQAADFFGAHVELSDDGSLLVASSQRSDLGGTDAGHVRFFRKTRNEMVGR